MPPKTIQIVGSLNIDLITRTPRHPNPGETLTATCFNYGPGGKGANQAVACARLSRSKTQQQTPSNTKIEMLGAVGTDFFGNYLLDELKTSGVDISKVHKIENSKSGTAVVIVEEQTGENRILISPGANASVFPPISLPPLPDLIILQLEIPIPTVVNIIQEAREKGVDVLLNPAPAVDNLPKDIYKGLKHLIMNETEAAILSANLDDAASEAYQRKRGNRMPENNTQDTCERFHALGVTNVIITLGANGVYYSFRNEKEGWGEGGHVPAEKVEKVVDTTAAGDTFVGAYAVAVTVDGTSVVDAVGWANRAGARTVEKEGAMGSIPWRDEVGGLEGER
ncbi:MAG: hypothetical protein Q9221_003123 [Calogaya cf. arnoldii]